MKVLIVDDEQPARDRLRQILEDAPDFEVVGEAANGREALEVAERTAPDIVLLDIRMPGMDGIEAAHHLNRLPQPPAVVFATAYDEYAIDAFDARAVGYVLKPVRRSRLMTALEQAERLAAGTLGQIASAARLPAARRHVSTTSHGHLVLIPVDDIACFRADQKYVRVDHDRGHALIDESLKALEEEFGDRFVRIHRGALVAVDRILRVERDDEGRSLIVLRPGSNVDAKELIISRRHVAEVRRRLKNA